MKPVKILFISASPNINGNTATLMHWVEEGVKDSGGLTEWIDLKGKAIHYCSGCNTCLKTGECVHDDYIQILKQKIDESDGLVVGSPVYEGHPCAQMKTVMDRFALFCLYMGIFDEKWAVGVSTSGIAPTAKTAKDCTDIFGKRSGIITSKTVKMTTGYFDLDKQSCSKLYSKARKTGKKLVSDIVSNPMFSPGVLKSKWIAFLRKNFLKKLILKNPEIFAGVIKEWETRKWL